jgi:phosphopantothenoylcysteine decarboxylase / phosphopantothenate---cysteine ligase
MMSLLAGKRILLVIGGGIAAYKTLELIRLLAKAGAQTRCILTKAGSEFVTPLSLSSLSGDTVYSDLFSLTDEAEMGHIELSRAADLVVVAPATADLMAKAATGLANDLASTTLLATDKRILFAPAMNVRMWLHPATQSNVATLQAAGSLVIGPNEGEMACGEYGPGRMAEPAEIVTAIEQALQGDTILPLPEGTGYKEVLGPLAGRKVIVTSGPTREPIDPVRYISNHSSGKQGHAIAAAAARAGAEVVLISGPVSLPDPPGMRVIHVETARDMLEAVHQALPADIAIFCAAVADWRVADIAERKMKKDGKGPPPLTFVENPDILATIARLKQNRPSLVIGFAAETHDVIALATDKRRRKACDWILANDVSPGQGVFGGDTNTIHLVTEKGVTTWPTMDKKAVAQRLIETIAGETR